MAAHYSTEKITSRLSLHAVRMILNIDFCLHVTTNMCSHRNVAHFHSFPLYCYAKHEMSSRLPKLEHPSIN